MSNVRHSKALGVEWPGDEWGDPAQWERFYQELFVKHGVSDWQKAVEIGQGSGKYTLKVLSNPDVHIRAYDVSESSSPWQANGAANTSTPAALNYGDRHVVPRLSP